MRSQKAMATSQTSASTHLPQRFRESCADNLKTSTITAGVALCTNIIQACVFSFPVIRNVPEGDTSRKAPNTACLLYFNHPTVKHRCCCHHIMRPSISRHNAAIDPILAKVLASRPPHPDQTSQACSWPEVRRG